MPREAFTLTDASKGGAKAPPKRTPPERPNLLAFASPKKRVLPKRPDGTLADYPADHPANDPDTWKRIGTYIALAPLGQVEEHAPSVDDTLQAFRGALGNRKRWPLPSAHDVAPLRRLIGVRSTPWVQTAVAMQFDRLNWPDGPFDDAEVDKYFIRRDRERKVVEDVSRRIESYIAATGATPALLRRLRRDLPALLDYKPMNDHVFRFYHPGSVAEDLAGWIRWAWRMAGAKDEDISFAHAENPGCDVLTWALRCCFRADLGDEGDLSPEAVARQMARQHANAERGRTPNLRKSRISRPGP